MRPGPSVDARSAVVKLEVMLSSRWSRPPAVRAVLFTLLTLLTAAACERDRQPPPPDTAEPLSLPADSAAPPLPPSAWDETAGPVLLVRGSDLGHALVVLPQYADSTLPDTLRLDAASVRDAVVDIFNRGGQVGQARVTGVRGTTWTRDDCIEWPEATVRSLALARSAAGRLAGDSAPPGRTADETLTPPDSSGMPGWSVAFIGGRVRPVALDSIEAFVRVDSARLAAETARLASLLPSDTAIAFRGIPFAVRTAYRFTAPDGADVLVADVQRKVNQEANPLEEHILLVAERGPQSGGQDARYRTVYSERSSGTEEGIEMSEVLAAVRLAGGRVAIVLGRQGYETAAYSLLERASPGRWRVRWTSVYTGC